ncbi:MAG TPA: alpha/beta hydrolase [Microbacterium sp.]|nr:alpha/beta hydrolase [Microbacterium sp.]
MNEPVDEFSFLSGQAEDFGIRTAIPRGERVGLTLPDGRTLSALRYGDAAPAVTFLHGVGLNAHTWDTTILALGLPALAIDLPGHGDSSWRADAVYTGRILAPDVATGIDAWTAGPQLLVGQSLGGLTAAAVAASRPDLVRELVIIDITPGVDPHAGPTQIRDFFAGPSDWSSREEMVDRALSFGLGGSRAAAERGVYLNSRKRPDGRFEWKHHFARLAAGAARASEAAAPTAQPDAVSGVLSATGWDDLAAVSAQVTLIRGDRGYVTDADSAEFQQHVRAASLVVVPSGHNVQEEIPVDLGTRLRELAGKG